MTTTRPPPKVLFVHNGAPYAGHIKHLVDAGLHVADAHADDAFASALTLQPDLVVLESADGQVAAQLKTHDMTTHIPIIALSELAEQR